ncbi:MAG: hypothetical protein A3C08_03195 [Candidatus Taylorbacteria bacterium RIFCSPHIGHO2_02_FULL_47_18]|uniref:Uncharacterized protein n=1 Tax=Candidatus Taylorbacteria bacterium RIFCSPLOWO2_01_FULL_48_100 TaxID=1802322 RepID=A0A1G2NGF0_9BACT|nr:MAG: hypothetical protein A3C08_03195 [Candidatus Taylorbacteria bacterium RIFCSPHIGHO2_02_FULL_47_18]OHA35155.1 MAG: hypothetical protein A2938_01960 [Candidatus Taylorbacteria bacterium RIFCSPLOWO2_01_FULL_48_100]OHA41068.1 MAG: hypothetical protein A3J31_03210 [Candidatus Taylorbacteria bacterium RIFCSPLOWO2_02_FULL_48_16]OHA45665.1 MAG: hypothetical protein A3H13_00170 [Candidatus Taylorbacteria bacterium RIFCSPLOWO2_12_FULL_48_11]
MKAFLLKIADKIGLTDKLVRRRIDAFLQKHATCERTLFFANALGFRQKHYGQNCFLLIGLFCQKLFAHFPFLLRKSTAM